MQAAGHLLVCALVAVTLACAVLLLTHRSGLASGETITTTLYPGANLVGWVEADAPAALVFDAIPQLQSVRSSAPGSSWTVQRSVGSGADSQTTLVMGRAYWFQIQSDYPVVWERALDRQAANHQLDAGRHMIAWAGVDGVPFRHALLALGEAASRAWRWDARGQRIVAWSGLGSGLVSLPIPDAFGQGTLDIHGDAQSWHLRPGDALGVTLARPMRWTQPGGELPGIRYVGDVSESAKRVVMEDAKFVTEHFARRFGVEVDPEHIEIVAGPRQALREVIETSMPFFSYFQPSSGLPQAWNRSQIVISLENWLEPDRSSVAGTRRAGRGTLLHEYFHAIQYHLAPTSFWGVPSWLIEGTAIASQAELSLSWASAGPEDVAPLRDIGLRDHKAADHPHAIGAIALRLLTDAQGQDSIFLFWQTLASMPSGPQAWERTFERTFGRTVERFAEEYASWMDAQFAAVTGRVEFGGRMDASQVAVEVEPAAQSIPSGRTTVDSEGFYSISVQKGVSFRVIIHSVDTGCFAYLSERGTWRTREDAHVFVQGAAGTVVPTVVGRPVGFICD